jgi:RNA polymerase sigma-70 factor (ECF subfamily)
MSPTKSEFQTEFLAFEDQLRSYLLRIVGNREDANDLTQDTYVKASIHLDSFLGRSSLKTWIFTIATNLARDHQRAAARWTPNCQENARADAYAHPELIDKLKKVSSNSTAGKYDLKEHIDFCFTCMAKTLDIEQQIAVILKDIYFFKISEIEQITGLSEGKVKHALADGRKTLIRIFDNKCALVSKKGACHQCSEMNGILNPKQNAQEELMKIRVVKEARKGRSKSGLYNLRTELVRKIDPNQAQGADLHAYFLTLMPDYCDSDG